MPHGSGGAAPRVLAVVPARLGSTRLPRKMLLRESGRYLFEHTVGAVRAAASVGRVVLATDSAEIMAAAREVDVEAVLTSEEHPSGTDRVHEALETLLARGEGPFDVVLNVQGDEPELRGANLDPLTAAFAEPEVRMATLATPLADPAQAGDPAVVKVVLASDGNALYFSRAAIPAHPGGSDEAGGPFLRHIGVYAFRPDALRRFCALPRGRLEQAERLEQLRWLEAGERIRVLTVDESAVGIDTPEQYAGFLAREGSRRPPPDPRPAGATPES